MNEMIKMVVVLTVLSVISGGSTRYFPTTFPNFSVQFVSGMDHAAAGVTADGPTLLAGR